MGNVGALQRFERYVNSKDNQTTELHDDELDRFERYVNSKDNQTSNRERRSRLGLRDM